MSRVEIVIVGFRNAADVRRCVSALAQQSHRDFGVHVCENGGAAAFDALVEALATLGELADAPSLPRALRSARIVLASGQDVTLHEAAGNLGYAGGINVCFDALSSAPHDYVWILNPDTVPDPHAIAALIAHQQAGGYGIVGSRLVLMGENRIQLYGGRWRGWIARGYNIGLGVPAEAPVDVAAIERALDYVSGASMFVPRAYVETAGKFDERYFLYCEELDWCFRRGAWRLGYAHDAIVEHAHGATIGSSLDKKSRSALSVYLDERNKLLFTRRFRARLYPLALLTTLLLIGQYARAGAWGNLRVALAGWWAGLRGETGLPPRFLPKN